MELSEMSFGGTRVPWNSMEYSMEFHGTNWYFIWRHQSSMEYSMEFHETNWYFIWRHKSSMEFHGIFHGIPWNTCVIWNGALLFPWNPMELGDFLFGHSRVPRNSMVHPIEVISKSHGIPWNWVILHLAAPEFHGISWNSMELGDSRFGGPRVPLDFVWLYLPWNFRSFMEFHGTSHLDMGIPWNSMEFGYIVKFHGTLKIPLNSMELLNWL